MDFNTYLFQKGYKGILGHPSTWNPHVIELEGGKMLKATKDFYEILAAEKLCGQLSDNVANIYEVDKYKDCTMIVVEKLEPLLPKEKKSHRRFERAFRRFFIFHYAIKCFTFGLIKPKFMRMKWLYSKNSKKWYDLAREMKKDAQRMGIKDPSDYLSIDNLGLKPDGKIACYDVRDVKDDIFYEKI